MNTERAWGVETPIFSAWSMVIGALVCIGPASGLSVATAQLTLVADGQPKALIVLPSKEVAPRVEPAAKILADHLFQMSGARLLGKREDELGEVKVERGCLVPESGKVGEGVGAFVLIGEGDIARRLGMTGQGLGPGGVLVKTGGNVLALLGTRSPSDPFSTRHAVISFLEQLGCRYLWPGELGKVVPKQTVITVGALDVRYTPKIGQRHIRFQGLSTLAELGLERLQLTKEEWIEARQNAMATQAEIGWGHWHRLGGQLGIRGGHARAGLKGGWEKHGAEHPEWFALQADGTRDQSKVGGRFRLCKEKDPALDLDQAQRLLVLNYFMLRDIVRNHHLAVNASYLMWGNGDCAAWSPIKGRGFRPATELLERVEAKKHTLTGKEDSIEEMLAAFGFDNGFSETHR